MIRPDLRYSQGLAIKQDSPSNIVSIKHSNSCHWPFPSQLLESFREPSARRILNKNLQKVHLTPVRFSTSLAASLSLKSTLLGEKPDVETHAPLGNTNTADGFINRDHYG